MHFLSSLSPGFDAFLLLIHITQTTTSSACAGRRQPAPPILRAAFASFLRFLARARPPHLLPGHPVTRHRRDLQAFTKHKSNKFKSTNKSSTPKVIKTANMPKASAKSSTKTKGRGVEKKKKGAQKYPSTKI
jgi:hypothetical protein